MSRSRSPDQGRGLAPERLVQLFRKQAGSTAGGRRTGGGGTGLGLAICKGLVEAHGGRIRAESAGVGQGARFTFTIPVAEETGAEAVEALGSRARGRRSRDEATRILVVDDDPQALRYVRDALAAEGYAPIVTGEPGEVSGLLRTEKPALVLLDLMLPGTDGDRADGERAGACRPSGDLHLRLRPGRDGGPRPGVRRRRLHRQALLAHRTHRADACGAARAGRSPRPSCCAISSSTTSGAG